MKLYLVRWHDHSISLVSAKSESELLSILDQVADPSACKWKEYKGPIHFEFKLDCEFENVTNYKKWPLTPKFQFSGIDKLADANHASSFVFGTEGSSEKMQEMWNEFTKFAFPNFCKYLDDKFEKADDSKEQRIQDVESALTKDLKNFAEYKQADEGIERKMGAKHNNENN